MAKNKADTEAKADQKSEPKAEKKAGSEFVFRTKNEASYSSNINFQGKIIPFECKKGIIKTTDSELADHFRKIYQEVKE